MPSIASWEETRVDHYGRLDRHESIATEPQQRIDPAWEQCIDALLKTWTNPTDDDCSVVPPTGEAVRAALEWIVFLRSRYPAAPPTLIAPEPNGGIIISRRDRAPDGSDLLSELTIYNKLTAESTLYRNGRVIHMTAIPARPPRSDRET